MEKINSRWSKLAVIIAGSFLYTFGMNYFLIPYGLYSGGGIGILAAKMCMVLFTF